MSTVWTLHYIHDQQVAMHMGVTSPAGGMEIEVPDHLAVHHLGLAINGLATINILLNESGCIYKGLFQSFAELIIIQGHNAEGFWQRQRYIGSCIFTVIRLTPGQPLTTIR